jgi:hypothetical protein
LAQRQPLAQWRLAEKFFGWRSPERALAQRALAQRALAQPGLGLIQSFAQQQQQRSASPLASLGKQAAQARPAPQPLSPSQLPPVLPRLAAAR